MPINTGSLLMALKPKYKTRQLNALSKKATTALLVKLLQQRPIAANTEHNNSRPI